MQALEFACQETLQQILSIRDGGAQMHVQADALRQRLHQSLEQMRRQATQLGCAARDVDAAHYALVALADETVTRHVPGLADLWRHALQHQYYGENLAGDGFFTRLASMVNDPSQRDVARIYALCLAFGFRGKFAVRGEAELDSQRRQLRERLGLAGAAVPLSPHVGRPREARTARVQKLPVLWISAFFAVFCVALVTMIKSQLDSKSETLATKAEILQPKVAGNTP